MKVKKLISELKKMPQNLEVGYAHHDNNEWEIAGDVFSVDLFDKDECECPSYVKGSDREWYDSQPQQVVILRG